MTPRPQPRRLQRIVPADALDEAAAHHDDVGDAIEQAHLAEPVGEVDVHARRRSLAPAAAGHREAPQGELVGDLVRPVRVAGRDDPERPAGQRACSDQRFLAGVGAGGQDRRPLADRGPQGGELAWIRAQRPRRGA